MAIANNNERNEELKKNYNLKEFKNSKLTKTKPCGNDSGRTLILYYRLQIIDR